MICNRQSRDLRSPTNDEPPFTTLRGFLEEHRLGPGAGGNRTERLFHLLQYGLGIEIASDDESRIVWVIVPAIIRLLLLHGRAFNILQPPNDRIPVRMDFECSCFLFLQKQTPRRIQSCFEFLDHNLLFSLELFGVERAIHKSVGFNFQCDVPPVGSKIEVIRGEIMRSEGVIGASIFESERINLTVLETLRTL